MSCRPFRHTFRRSIPNVAPSLPSRPSSRKVKLLSPTFRPPQKPLLPLLFSLRSSAGPGFIRALPPSARGVARSAGGSSIPSAPLRQATSDNHRPPLGTCHSSLVTCHLSLRAPRAPLPVQPKLPSRPLRVTERPLPPPPPCVSSPIVPLVPFILPPPLPLSLHQSLAGRSPGRPPPPVPPGPPVSPLPPLRPPPGARGLPPSFAPRITPVPSFSPSPRKR